jgi:flagellar basal-body rod protein FlgB
VTPQVERVAPGSADSELRLDLEMSDSSDTASRYGALVDVLNRQLQLQSLAITGSN